MVVAKYHRRKTNWTEKEFRCVVAELHPNIVIQDNFINMDTKISCYCTKDSNKWFVKPRNMVTDGTGCPSCARRDNGRKYAEATKGINDIATKYPHLVKYFVNKEEAFFYRYQSNIKVELKCPYCNNKRSMAIYSLTSRGFNCSVCGDGVSYPNKIGRMMVLQLPVNNIEFEWNPSWMTGKSRFDIKFEYQRQIYVIEMDGHQHYVEDISFTRRSLSEIQKEDQIKNDSCKKIM
jgi:ribosomal protein S27E